MKSCSRVPTATMTSAASATALVAEEPVTPIEPRFSGWSRGSDDLPAWVSPTGTLCVSAKALSASVASA